MEGVLRNWAVAKGPPTESGIRRLAVQVDDHPVSYIDSEDDIGEGLYAAGKVAIWDSGEYALIHTGAANCLLLKRKGLVQKT